MKEIGTFQRTNGVRNEKFKRIAFGYSPYLQ